ncbi:MAG TPA: PKD domain-containing protein [Flavobacteriales bacterium]|nr:PKD domain-containing protein [Flavobacteriales bacterium]
MRYRFLSLLLVCFSSGLLSAQELCDNGVDDDNDGLIDLNDTLACRCTALSVLDTAAMIPNPSFEEHDCWPSQYVQFACAQDWYSASGSTPDYHYVGDIGVPWVPLPLAGGGNGYVGGYAFIEESECFGTCLLQPMIAGTSYTFRMYVAGSSDINGNNIPLPPMDVTLWGYSTCPTWPPGPPLGPGPCPGAFGWTALASVPYVPEMVWQQVTMTFTPATDIAAIVLGDPCSLPPEYSTSSGNTPYILYDALELHPNGNGLSGTVARTGAWCTDDLVLHASADTSAATFQWYREGVALVGRTDSLLAVSTLDLVPGTYQVRIALNDTTCIVRSITLDAPAPVTASFTAGPLIGCAPLDVAFVNTSVADSIASVRWDFGDGTTSTALSPTHRYTAADTFSVTLQVTDTAGCSADTTVADLIITHPQPEAALTFGPQPTDVFATEQAFVNTSSDDVIAWWWTFSGGVPGTDTVPDPTVRFPGNEAGTYNVRLVVANAFGCMDTVTATVVIDGVFTVYVPNSFTPDGDGVNDGWRPIGKDMDPEHYSLRVFDRWGEEIWQSTDMLRGWDGKVDGHDPKTDIYVWQLEVRDAVERHGHELRGHVTVLR